MFQLSALIIHAPASGNEARCSVRAENDHSEDLSVVPSTKLVVHIEKRNTYMDAVMNLPITLTDGSLVPTRLGVRVNIRLIFSSFRFVAPTCERTGHSLLRTYKLGY